MLSSTPEYNIVIVKLTWQQLLFRSERNDPPSLPRKYSHNTTIDSFETHDLFFS